MVLWRGHNLYLFSSLMGLEWLIHRANTEVQSTRCQCWPITPRKKKTETPVYYLFWTGHHVMTGRRLHVQPTVLFPGLWRTSNKYKLLLNKNYSHHEFSGYLYRLKKLWVSNMIVFGPWNSVCLWMFAIQCGWGIFLYLVGGHQQGWWQKLRIT
jgi:hypothetical protein